MDTDNGEGVPFNFLLLLGSKKKYHIRRVPLESGVQAVLSQEIEKQAARLIPEDQLIPYSPHFKPDEECMYVEGFQLPESLATASEKLSTFDSVSNQELEGDRSYALVAVRNVAGPELYFQNLDNRQVLKRSWRNLLLSGDTFVRLDQTGLQIQGQLAAAYRDGTLYFRTEHNVRRILSLDEVFREATDTEVDGFVSHSIWASSISRESHGELFTTRNRRKIKSVLERGVLGEEPQRIKYAAAQFGIEVELVTCGQTTKVQLPADKKEFAELLAFLDDDYLPSPLTEDYWHVSSKRPLSRP